MGIIDITPLISEDIAVFPGDTPFRLTRHFQFSKGDHLDLASFSGTLHLGAHADAPSHYRANGKTSETLNLEAYIGPCRVIDVTHVKTERIYPKDVKGLDELTERRVLFRTDSFPDPNHWNSDFKALSPELIVALDKKGVILVGIDTPSVDPETSKALETHQALADTNMRVLEGIVLTEVKEGSYILLAAPLRIANAEAAPTRALLLTSDLSDLKD